MAAVVLPPGNFDELVCRSGGISPISSRNSVPPSACSKRPRNQFLAVPDLPLISTVGFAKAAWAPDSPLGFAFGEACRAHDRCYAEGGGFSDCNAGFYTALREAAGGNIVGEALALLYATANYALGWAWYGFPPQDPFGGPNGG